jgi:hypothetical protein
MKKETIILLLAVIFSAKGYSQTVNKELDKSNPMLLEQPSRNLAADEILNGHVHWKNPFYEKIQYNDSGFDYSKIGKVPAKGIHPRMFTSPDEFGKVKERLLHTQIGRTMLELADKQIQETREGKGIYGKIYQMLLHQALDSKQAAAIRWEYTSFTGWKFMNQLAVQGLLAKIYKDEGLDKETSIVAANYIRSFIPYIEQLPVVEGLEGLVKEPIYGGAFLAKLYDFTATNMKREDRQYFDDFMVQQTTGKYSVGMNLPPHWRRWNHVAMPLAYPLSMLSVEKEAQTDCRIYQRGKELAEDYYTYQFSPEGMSTEGMNYTLGQSVYDFSFLIAMARRGDKNLLTHPHIKAMPDWFMNTLSPNPKALWYTGGDTGSISRLPWTLVMLLKYFYPNDLRLDYLLANSLPAKITEIPDIMAFLCCADPHQTAEQYDGTPTAKMPLTYYSPMRGAFITRNGWNKQAVKFSLEGRTDTYFISHDHSDRGTFSLSANGREWVVDGFRSTESKYHSIITIDGRGEGYFSTPASWLGFTDNSLATFGIIDSKYCYDWLWLKSPAADLMLGRQVASKWANGVYKDVATRLKRYYPGEMPERDPLENVAKYYSGNLYNNALIWNEDTWPMRLKNNPVQYAYRTAGLIRGKHTYALIVDDIQKDNGEHLYEFAMPMPLDVELVSIKQMANVEMQKGALNLGFNSISSYRQNGEYDIIVGDKSMKRDMRAVDDEEGGILHAGSYQPQKGNPQLLVRVLDKKPAPRPNLEGNPHLETMEQLKTEDMHQFYLRTMGLGKRLILPARCIGAPQFKVLLFPYLHGEELPQTIWNNDRTELTVKWSDQTDLITFKKGEDGRTRISIKRNNEPEYFIK